MPFDVFFFFFLCVATLESLKNLFENLFIVISLFGSFIKSSNQIWDQVTPLDISPPPLPLQTNANTYLFVDSLIRGWPETWTFLVFNVQELNFHLFGLKLDQRMTRGQKKVSKIVFQCSRTEFSSFWA